MPRKQVSRRRKGRKSVQYDFAEAPEGDVSADEDAEETAEAPEEAEVAAPGASYVRSNAPDTRGERHVNRDYTHVRNEVVRILIIGSVLIGGIIVAGFFR